MFRQINSRKFFTFFLLAAYFTIAGSHIFFMQKAGAHSHHAANSIFKKRTENLLLVPRAYKTTIEKKVAFILPAQIDRKYDFRFAPTDFNSPLRLAPCISVNYITRHYYLEHCVFRI